MKNTVISTVVTVCIMVLLAGCATMPQMWPDSERSAENKMIVVQEKIGEGLKTGTLSPDQAQMFLTTLKGIRTDYTRLKDKKVYRDEWDKLNRRLDTLEGEIGRAYARPEAIENHRNGERMVALQRRIDDGRVNRRLPQKEGEEFQYRMNSIRREYLRLTEGGRYTTREEGADISRRLDSLEKDFNRYISYHGTEWPGEYSQGGR
jgi:hypothetical protein